MTDSRTQQVDLANLAAAIERAAVDLALAEEPSRFIVALEEAAGGGAGDDGRDHRGAGRRIRTGKVSPVEATEDCLARISRLDGRLRAFITLDPRARSGRRGRSETDATAGRWRGPLHGVPLAFKDLCHLARAAHVVRDEDEGIFRRAPRLHRRQPTGGGRRHHARQAQHDGAGHGPLRRQCPPRPRPEPVARGPRVGRIVERLRRGGGGGALAWARSAATPGGSIRLPAACCGVVGLKPTYGRVSRAGAMALSWSNDHIGPLTRTVRDAALLFADHGGPRSARRHLEPRAVPDYLDGIDDGITGLRVAVPENFFFEGVDPEMEAGVREALGTLARHGRAGRGDPLPDPRR